MSYLVLARKWRPGTFEEVVGQRHVTRTLANAIKNDRVAHAFLFTGSRGVGKTSCARILARALNCDNGGPTPEPCGSCPTCTEIIAGRSVDVFEIDGASNNGVEQVRELRDSVKFVSSRGKRKIYIIDEVHMLTTAAFNALLKTLEEPPEHVLFIFATTEPHKIPDTILSRCQRHDFKRIPEGEIVEAIARIADAEGLEVERAALHHIAREAKGGMRDSLSLLDQVIAFCGQNIAEAEAREVLGIADRSVLFELLRCILQGDGARALSIVDELFRYGLDLQKFAAELARHLRDMMVVKVCPQPETLVDLPAAEIQLAAELVRDVPPAGLHRLFNALLQGAEEIARSQFPKLLFEMTLLRLCEQGPTMPLSQVLDGLARLEARLDHELPPEPTRPGPGAPPPGRPSPGPSRPGPVGLPPSTGGGPSMAAAVQPTPAEPPRARPVLRVVEPEPEPEPEPEVEPEPEPEPEPVRLVALDLEDGRSALDHLAHYVAQLREQDSFLAAELRQAGRILGFKGQRMGVAVPDSALPGLNRGIGRLDQVLRAVLGAGWSVELVPCPEGHEHLAAETLYERQQRRAAARREARKEAARQDEVVRAVVETFDAEIVGILPRDPSPR